MNKKKLLFIAYYYHPDRSIGAIRPTKLIKYLSSDYEITVLTRKREGNSSELYRDQYASRVIEADSKETIFAKFAHSIRGTGIYAFFRKKDLEKRKDNFSVSKGDSEKKIAPAKQSFFRKLSQALLQWQNEINDMAYYKNARCILDEDILNGRFDAVISTFAPMSDHLLAYRYKKNHPDCRWIADFRDTPIQDETNLFLRIYYARQMRHIVKYADNLVCINKYEYENMGLEAVGKNKTISNGFDPDDYLYTSSEVNEKFTLLYTGNLYRTKSTLLPVFEALSYLICNGIIDKNRIQLVYAGQDFAIFEEQAKVNQVESIIVDAGFLTFDEVRKLQTKANAFLLASWNNKREKGIVTGKFFEYLAMRKNIICCVTGDTPDSILKEYIEGQGIGICVEEATLAYDVQRLIKYLKQIYREYIEKGYVDYKVDDAFVQQFSHISLANQFAKLIVDK